MEDRSSLHEVIELLHRMAHLQWSKVIPGLSKADYFTMNYIAHHTGTETENRGVYACAMASHIKVSRPAISRQLQRLEERGWICRSVDPNSRRNSFVSLTEEGESVLRQQSQAWDALYTGVLERVGEARMQEILCAMRELTTALEEEIAESKNPPEEKRKNGGNECDIYLDI